MATAKPIACEQKKEINDARTPFRIKTNMKRKKK